MQGEALEYHIDSLPSGVRNLLVLKEGRAAYDVERQDPLAVWIEYYYHLTESEREKMVAFPDAGRDWRPAGAYRRREQYLSRPAYAGLMSVLRNHDS